MEKELFKIEIKESGKVIGYSTPDQFFILAGDPNHKSFLQDHIKKYNEWNASNGNSTRATQVFA